MPRTLREAAAAFPFRLTHVLTDNGSCFTPAFARACAELGAEYRHTRPYSPHTNGMVERFNGRVGGEVLGITVWSHQQLERLLRGFNAAYNARRQRVLDGKTPDQVVAERLRSRRRLAKPKPEGGAGAARAERNRARRDAIADARLVAEAAKDVSPPDSYGVSSNAAWMVGGVRRGWRHGPAPRGGPSGQPPPADSLGSRPRNRIDP